MKRFDWRVASRVVSRVAGMRPGVREQAPAPRVGALRPSRETRVRRRCRRSPTGGCSSRVLPEPRFVIPRADGDIFIRRVRPDSRGGEPGPAWRSRMTSS